MIDHLSFYSTDFEKTQAFYQQALAALGYQQNVELVAQWNEAWPTQRLCAFGPGDKPCLWLIESKEAASPRHVAFTAPNREAVDAFHQAAVATGGEDNGAPGLRPQYHKDYYGAFVIDPDGNNIEAVCHRGA